MVRSGLTRMFAGALAVVAGVVAVPAGGGAQEASSFPAPVIAPGGTSVEPGPADVVAFYRDPAVPVAEPVVVVELATAVPSLPDGTRVSVIAGDPNGDQVRTSLRWEGGTPVGVIESGGADGFGPLEEGPPALAEVTAAGHARLGVQATAGDAGVWVETETGDGVLFTTPVFPLSQVIESAGPGALAPATTAAMSGPDNVPTGEWVTLAAVPTLEARPQDITVRTTQPIPTEVEGLPVAEVRDFLRIAPTFADTSQAPYFVYIDYTAGTVTFFDSAGGIPVPIEADEASWLIDGLDGTDVETSSVVLDRPGLLEAVGLPADMDVAIGVSRAVVFEDGRYLTAEAPMALQSWFGAGSGVVEVTPTTAISVPPSTAAPAPTATVDTGAGEDGGPNATVLVAATVIAVALAGVALYASRQNRKALLGDPDSALDAMAKVVDKTSHDADGGDDDEAASGIPARRPPAAGGGVRVPTTRDRAVAEAVGVKGARAAVSREAQARVAANRDAGEEASKASSPSPAAADSGRDALWAAMRKKAAEAAEEDAEASQHDAGSADGGTTPAPGPVSAPGANKSTDPDEALDALNRFIEDLRMPDDR